MMILNHGMAGAVIPPPADPAAFTSPMLLGTPAEVDARVQALAAETAEASRIHTTRRGRGESPAQRAARDSARRARGAAYQAAKATEAAKATPAAQPAAKAQSDDELYQLLTSYRAT